ncbi:MAG: ABC transporter ATP-binding protein [Acidimicrobiia bacterium]|nr:ABC transporter ATP-binding protein [Acidimicrobiia bacterium]MDH4307725.1 ABC transporter ATP-binding protein [Acidimicrobiia bacterium]MDH5293956.1 ABC transporter ATP-binding protein [Acidimicrobiia bacterium]
MIGQLAVSWDNIGKRFGQTVAVDGVSLDIDAGSFFGIVGPNGAGKTTLLRMTTGLLRPDTGSVTVAGIDVWSDPVEAKRRFGVVPDDPRLFDRLTGRELLSFLGELRNLDPETTRERGGALLRLLDLNDAADSIVADYSLGMTKKIAIAAALLHDPKVVFLDEPFAGVDPVARQVLEQILRRHTERGGTVVFSDHAMDVVERLCDNLMLIDHGTVRAAGNTAEITGGRRLQDVFVELVGAHVTDEGDLRWLGSSSD